MLVALPLLPLLRDRLLLIRQRGRHPLTGTKQGLVDCFTLNKLFHNFLPEVAVGGKGGGVCMIVGII